MPLRSSVKKKSSKKRTYKKRTYKTKSTVPKTVKYNANKSMVNLGKAFPKKVIMTHRYVEDVAFASTLGGLGKYKFVCNGMFDPNSTGTGHQPFCFDQLTALYNHYIVIGSKIKFTILPVSTAPSFAYGIMIDDDTTNTFIGYDAIAEQSLSKVAYSPANNSTPRRLSMTWSAKKMFGGSILSNTTLQGTSTSNPTEQSIYTVFIQAADGTSTVTTQLLVEIEYTAIWRELKDLAQS